ncbi:hypothetical protein ABIE09_001738 [Lysobacter enzymogenes]|uniref:hypothetical protein n=1 Tax=Lysobacter enzymogenes TaxID=69 RepID=UPI003391782E
MMHDPYSGATRTPTAAEITGELPAIGTALASALERLATLPTRDGCAHMISRLGRLDAYVRELRRALEREEASKD